jgi:hypothetical protein
MHVLNYPTSEEAWVKVNQFLINSDKSMKDRLVMSNQVILYDVLININRSYIPEDWDFTATVNYTKAKWTSLVGNYVDLTHMEEVISVVHHRELKKDKNYNISMWFSNQHGAGKGCLLSCTFSRRYGEEYPMVHAVMRASEFYKRGAFDLLLIHRLGQEAFGEDAHFGVRIFAHQLWGGADWVAMLVSKIPPEELFKNQDTHSFTREVKKMYDYFMGIKDPNNLRFHSHKRAVAVIQGQVRGKRLLASDCIL